MGFTYYNAESHDDLEKIYTDLLSREGQPGDLQKLWEKFNSP